MAKMTIMMPSSMLLASLCLLGPSANAFFFAPKAKPTVVVCPGFGNAKIDYVSPLGASEDTGFKSVLERRGFNVEIVPVERYDWVRVAGGLADPAFYQSKQEASGRAYGWYLERVKETIASCADAERILLVGHSAGGWLARAALGAEGIAKVCGLVTLGAPQVPPPKGINCATRGALETTNIAYPGAFLDIPYVTVAGKSVTCGDVQRRQAVDDVYEKRGEGSVQNVAKINYEAVSGSFEGVSGDGVIPIDVAHLEGAEQITIDGVRHSINEAGTAVPTDSWYGSEKVVDQWLSKAMDQLK